MYYVLPQAIVWLHGMYSRIRPQLLDLRKPGKSEKVLLGSTSTFTVAAEAFRMPMSADALRNPIRVEHLQGRYHYDDSCNRLSALVQ